MSAAGSGCAGGPLQEAVGPDHETGVRVRFVETDAMGIVHHASYLPYFEIGRTEWLRARGVRYRELAEAGLQLVVAEASVRYRRPARYDDQLTICTSLREAHGARIVFAYAIRRGEESIVTGETRLACVGAGGRPTRLPAGLRRCLAAALGVD